MTDEIRLKPTMLEQTPAVYEFPVEPVRTPLYSNACLINMTGNDVFIEFGFADSYPVKPEKVRVDGRGIQIVTVAPVARLAINLQVASTLYRQLDDLFKALGEFQQGNGGENGAQQ